MDHNFVLEKNRHCLIVDENQQVSRGENDGLIVYDNKSELLSELPLSSKVVSFFGLSLTNGTGGLKDEERMQINNLDTSKKQEYNIGCDEQKSAIAVWNDKAVKLLFTLYKDHQDDFKSTSIKNNSVWDKIGNKMKSEKYNFTRTQIKDKWINMRKHYMRVKDYNKQTGAERKTYRYYDEMDKLYGNKPNVNPIAIASNMRKNIEDEITLSSLEDNTTDDDQRIRKKSKVERQLSSWSDKFILHIKEQKDRREQRHAERVAAIENATKSFCDTMEKLIDKL
ncbi:uncharacterized protein LOC105181165 isoform X2 [Harpegnathos saltator]|uniref:uncharacterized protein LOC105181165 isoform X2 n=1 Tax=Harpegnathos saltator TaxID=610380 RepID=UPI00058F25EA|nr:uncharacterized protein LOC105181165 isoform X2 [Harpegnathos saltator]